MLSACRMVGGKCAWNSYLNSKACQRLVAYLLLGLECGHHFSYGVGSCIYLGVVRWKLYFLFRIHQSLAGLCFN